MCDIKIEQSKWPTWQVRVHEQKRKPREDRAKKRARGEKLRKKEECEGKLNEIRRKEQLDRSVVPSLRKSARR